MAQHTSQFDIDCLRLIAADPDARLASLSAAMIKLHALTIARADPGLRNEALEIVRHLETLYRRLPTRESLAQLVRGRSGNSRIPDEAVESLIDAILEHFRCGRD